MRVVGVIGVSLALLLVAVPWASSKTWPTKVPSADERGKELYERHCVACHGPKGAGDGPLAAAIGGVPNFEQGYGDRDEKALAKVVLYGKGKMPGFDTSFVEADAQKVTRYLGGLGRRPVKPAEPKKEATATDDEAGGGGG
jgi:mono/diheme cytochrome c family protein